MVHAVGRTNGRSVCVCVCAVATSDRRWVEFTPAAAAAAGGSGRVCGCRDVGRCAQVGIYAAAAAYQCLRCRLRTTTTTVCVVRHAGK